MTNPEAEAQEEADKGTVEVEVGAVGHAAEEDNAEVGNSVALGNFEGMQRKEEEEEVDPSRWNSFDRTDWMFVAAAAVAVAVAAAAAVVAVAVVDEDGFD